MYGAVTAVEVIVEFLLSLLPLQAIDVANLNDALLFIRGERPVMDLKYDILKHPNIRYTEDGGAEPYEHGTSPASIATISAFRLDNAALEEIPDVSIDASNYELWSEEDFEPKKEEPRRPK